jgi:hypothetical protein
MLLERFFLNIVQPEKSVSPSHQITHICSSNIWFGLECHCENNQRRGTWFGLERAGDDATEKVLQYHFNLPQPLRSHNRIFLH